MRVSTRSQPMASATAAAWTLEQETSTSKAASCKVRNDPSETRDTISERRAGMSLLHLAHEVAVAIAWTSCNADSFSGAMLSRSVCCRRGSKSALLASSSTPVSLLNARRPRISHARLRTESPSFCSSGDALARAAFCVTASRGSQALDPTAAFWQSLYPEGFSCGSRTSRRSCIQDFRPGRRSRSFPTRSCTRATLASESVPAGS
mmetsp:Transcript_86463/g.245230  ORF Transcript_86463/g.245230 Transcript_86463/m.245230 type:complete len:206 (+) Transcript_86463:1-618(+)